MVIENSCLHVDLFSLCLIVVIFSLISAAAPNPRRDLRSDSVFTAQKFSQAIVDRQSVLVLSAENGSDLGSEETRTD